MKNNHESIESQKLKYIPPTVDCFAAEILTAFNANSGSDGLGSDTANPS